MILPNHDFTARERTVCDLLAPLCGGVSMLNVGMRHPEDPRNWWWLKICQANGIEPYVLEIFQPNCQQLRNCGLVNVTHGDVRVVNGIYDRHFDVILWWHGPEHLPKTEAIAAIDALWQITDSLLLLGTPLGDQPQGPVYGNPHEEHRSAWQTDDFAALGFQTTIVRDKQPYPHITAWRQRPVNVRVGAAGATSQGKQSASDNQQLALGDAAAARSPQEIGNDFTKRDGLATPAANDRNREAQPLVQPRPAASKTIRRVALVFDDRTRPETTGVYCRRALESLVEVEFFHPEKLAEIPRDGFDLYLNIDDGMDYRWPDDLRPSAFWAIDTHLDFPRSRRRADSFDVVFAAQRDGAALLRQERIESASWLPLACDPEIHGRQTVPVQYDVAFVGNVFPGPREDLVRLVQQNFRKTFIGRAYFEKMARIYSASRTVFNRSVRNDINMRVFEALCSGSLLLTNDLAENGQAELFRDRQHLVIYQDGEELVDKLHYYVRNKRLRKQIAAAGRQEVLAKHTYLHRMMELLETVSKHLSANTVVRGFDADANPQARMDSAATKDPCYFEFARPELLALVPESARRILEIGCGAGRLGEALRARQPCQVIGVELDPQAAAAAAGRLDGVLACDVEATEFDFPPGDFDVVICGDVLEHLCDPKRLLIRAERWLKPEGLLVASIPNVRHHSVVRSLIDGNFSYEPAGLLDSTHLRFFARRDIEQLLDEAGYEARRWQVVPGPGFDEWQHSGRPGSVDLGRLRLDGLGSEEAEEFFVYQWLVTGAPKRAGHTAGQINSADSCAQVTDRPVRESKVNPVSVQAASAAAAKAGTRHAKLPPCLVLMVTYNRFDYTWVALEAALALEYPGPWQLVVWDNGSTDQTLAHVRERLRGIDHARLIESPANRGVVYPMNEVWGAARDAELLAKLDNDTWVPPDLLRRLAECHQAGSAFGVLSGFHFRKEGESLADESRILEIDGVCVLPQPYVGGCAVMLRRAVFDELGPIPCRTEAQSKPFMDSGWTFYQQQMHERGLVNGYPWPPIHVDHMEDVRSPRCVRTAEHQQYKQALRGMSLEEFTEQLCVWRPNWLPTPPANGDGHEKAILQAALLSAPALGRSSTPAPSSIERAAIDAASMRAIPNPNTGEARGACRMRFTQDFRRDFDQFDFWGPAFAFARFADGERAILMGQPIQGQDGWSYAGGNSEFREALMAALRFNGPDYYLGISDGCCDQPAKKWYLEQITLPLSRVTFSNIFVNGNYERFRQLDTSEMAIVASEGGDYWVPADAMNARFDIDPLVERLLKVDRPILVSAGPASCIIIHRYWQRAKPEKRRTIVDVGSAIDERTKGVKTRQYQVPGTRTAGLICTW